MEDFVSMDEEEGIEELLHDLLDLSQGEMELTTLQQASEIMLTEVQHQVDTALVTIVWCF